MTAEKNLLAVPGCGEIKIFFNENLYLVDRKEIESLVTAGIISGSFIGADLDDLDYGGMVCRYNPVRISLTHAMHGVEKILDYIKSTA